MAGHIRCAKCEGRRTTSVCPHCGEYKCYISVYFNKRHWRFWKYKPDGRPLDFDRAERQLNVIRTQIDEGTFAPSGWKEGKIAERQFSVQIDAWLRQREADYAADELAAGTIRLYKSYNNNHFYPFFKGTDVQEIDDKKLRDFKDVIREKNLSLKTKRNILAIFHIFLVWLKNNAKIIKEIPIIPEIDGDDTVVVKVTEYEDQQTILSRFPEEFADSIEFMMETGLRPGELCALWISDISLSRHEATIQRTYSGHVLKFSTKGKNKKPIPLSDRALDIARKHIGSRAGNLPLFVNPRTGRGYRPRTLQVAWNEHSGCKGEIHLKDATRHSFCTQIVESGATQLEAMALMRHSDIRSTLKYFHANTKKLRHIVNRRGKVKDILNRTGTERGK
ncbi:MAG: site-specific integrase [Nitrospirae bacterium]|nr:site-specific integrase [Nitrospirota bacterium]